MQRPWTATTPHHKVRPRSPGYGNFTHSIDMNWDRRGSASSGYWKSEQLVHVKPILYVISSCWVAVVHSQFCRWAGQITSSSLGAAPRSHGPLDFRSQYNGLNGDPSKMCLLVPVNVNLLHIFWNASGKYTFCRWNLAKDFEIGSTWLLMHAC